MALAFETLAACRDEAIDVALGAALIARDVYGTLDVDGLLARFDELADPLRGRELAERPPRVQAQHLAQHLYETCGFSGNEVDYYDPRNSLLPDVLERKLGIPITLAVVYCEVAKRLGVQARGVGFPGHFLVRIDAPTIDRAGEEPVFVDPFFRGRLLDQEALARLLKRVTGREEEVRGDYLAPASSRAILVRMLVNLRSIYLSRNDVARALLAIDRILCLTPDSAEALRDRGLLSARLGANESARLDLERFLQLAPEAEDAAAVRERLESLRGKRVSLN